MVEIILKVLDYKFDITKGDLRGLDYVDNNKDFDKSDFESKTENDILPYPSHRAMYNMVVKALSLIYVTLIPILCICIGVGCLNI